MYSIIYVPSHIKVRTKWSGGFGGEHGSPGEHRYEKLDPVTGKYLIGENGCRHFNNCFECPFPECRLNNKRCK